MATYERYWIFPQEGDELPGIGSGFRGVCVSIGRKWVRIKSAADQTVRIKLKVWEQIPHIKSRADLPLAAAINALRSYSLTSYDL